MALRTRGDPSLGTLSTFSNHQSASLVERLEHKPHSDWYLSNSHERWEDPAEEAYREAVESVQNELTVDEAIWLRSQNSLADVKKSVDEALKEYQTKSRGSKARKWLSNCSSRVMYYGAIFDTFSQHHPEYVSLAWGAMKFLFIAVLNHEELLVEISKAITRIADVLPRTELHSDLYPIRRIQEAVSLVYAKIIEFFIKAIKWYKKGKLTHSITSIAKPFSISFKPIIEEVTERSKRVDELANAASKAEIRDLHVTVVQLKGMVDVLQQQQLLQLEQMRLQLQQQVLHNQSLLAIQGEYKHLFRENQIDKIRETIFPNDLPGTDDSLAYCRSMRDRRRQRNPTLLPAQALSILKYWVAEPSSSLLLAQGQGIKTSSLDFATNFLDIILERGYPVMWALPSPTEENKSVPSAITIFQSLVSQALSLDPGVVSEGSNPVTVKHFKSATSIQQWLTLFERCISSFPRLFLVIDIGLVELAIEHREEDQELFTLRDFVEQLSGLVSKLSSGLKIVIISWRFDIATTLEAKEVFDETQIFTDMGKKTERLMRRPKFRSIFRRRNQIFVEKFRTSILSAGN
ncbi:hypothetical protein GGS26DRAFT_572530 [Hypomontagnella submonticulosa]|nr:hypothetical protein GGS26DRAFT_572530 [Hypomontagnella submonticulosa]